MIECYNIHNSIYSVLNIPHNFSLKLNVSFEPWKSIPILITESFPVKKFFEKLEYSN